MHPPTLEPGDALVIVDVQRDFCAGGALAVPQGDEVVPVLNAWIDAARGRSAPVVVTRDWHPANHSSFQPRGGPWPVHCVAGTPGAEFHPQLAVPPAALVIDKGTGVDAPGYSAFDGTNLCQRLRSAHIRRLWIGGLAQDYCVRATAIDACRAGFEVRVISDATRAVDPSGGQQALEDMQAAGAVIC